MSGSPNEQSEGDEFAEGAVPPKADMAIKAGRVFEAWHKPRKQIVRRTWATAVSRLMKDIKNPIGSPKVLRYFTLPAPEMLDIRHLRECAIKRNYKVQYVGFTNIRIGSSDDSTLQLGCTTLGAQTSWIHGDSDILYYRLEELAAGPQPVARRKLSEYAPFHVVNFDLCDYILSRGPKGELLDALEQILRVQTSRPNGQNSWLLFITTRFDPTNTCSDRFSRIRGAIESNCASSQEFQKNLETLLEMQLEDLNEVLKEPASLSQNNMRDLLIVGLSKWIANLLLQASPPFKLELLNSFSYAVDGSKQDMLSLVYRCQYAGYGCPTSSGPAIEPDNRADTEVSIALGILQKADSVRNIDAELLEDIEKRDELMMETKELLRSANYNEALLSTYDDWARGKAALASPASGL